MSDSLQNQYQTDYTIEELDNYYDTLDSLANQFNELFKAVEEFKKSSVHNIAYQFVLDSFFFIRSFKKLLHSLIKKDSIFIVDEYKHFLQLDKSGKKGRYNLLLYTEACNLYIKLFMQIYKNKYNRTFAFHAESDPFKAAVELQRVHRDVMKEIYKTETQKSLRRAVCKNVLNEIIHICLKSSKDILNVERDMNEMVSNLLKGNEIERVLNTTIPLRLILEIRKNKQ